MEWMSNTIQNFYKLFKKNRFSDTQFSMSNKTQEAGAAFKNGINCAQSVLSTFSPELGLGRTEALRVASGFGAGMGHMGKVCGAVTGAIMTIGLALTKTKGDKDQLKENIYRLTREFMARFSEIHGAVDCRALIGVDLSSEAGLKEARERGLFDIKCGPFVEDAVRILEEILP
jgi:C_GCAxxG_C_C family probable redox protein